MIAEKITAWFTETWGGGLVLPDGWFGRPYDNIHRLESVTEKEDGLVVVLDDGQLTLKFEGSPKIEATKSELVFSGFQRLTFDWKEYGSMEPHSDEYGQGEVKIVAPPGKQRCSRCRSC